MQCGMCYLLWLFDKSIRHTFSPSLILNRWKKHQKYQRQVAANLSPSRLSEHCPVFRTHIISTIPILKRILGVTDPRIAVSLPICTSKYGSKIATFCLAGRIEERKEAQVRVVHLLETGKSCQCGEYYFPSFCPSSSSWFNSSPGRRNLRSR